MTIHISCSKYDIGFEKEIMREAYAELLAMFLNYFRKHNIDEKKEDKENPLVLMYEKAKYTYNSLLGTKYNTLEEIYELRGQFKLMKSLLKENGI